MTPTQRKAMEQALEALEGKRWTVCGWRVLCDEAIAALRAALAEPAPEPYAWMAVGGTIWRHKGSEDDVPLCIPWTPPADVPLLTDEERYDLYRQAMGRYYVDSMHYWLQSPARKYAAAIEQLVRQKAGLK